MKITEAMEKLGVYTKAGLARKLGIHRQQISQWGDDVPKLREYQITLLAQVHEAQQAEKTARKQNQ